MGSVEIYTDGACSQNPGPGGWATVICAPQEKYVVIQGGDFTTTNNRMELRAIIEGLRFAQDCGLTDVKIYSDSAYCVNMINQKWIYKWCTNGWRKADGKSVENQDLVQEFFRLYQSIPDVQLIHVRGHADNQLNNLCDKLAVGVYTSRNFTQRINTHSKADLFGPAGQVM